MRGERLRQNQLYARCQRLIPSFFHGAFAGNQTTCGLDVETVPIDRLTPLVGSVFQNPKTQYFNANVTDELAFPAENIGLPAEDINRRSHGRG